MERDTDQALLCAVVQVAFDAPPLTVRRGDHASLGRLNLRQPRPRHRRELRVLQRQPGSGCDRREHLTLIGAPGDQKTKHRARLVRQDDVPVVAGHLGGLAASGVDPSRLARDSEVHPFDTAERRHRSGQPGSQPVHGRTGTQGPGRDHADRKGDDCHSDRLEDQQQTGSCAVPPGRQPQYRRHDLHAQPHQHGANDQARGSRIAVSRHDDRSKDCRDHCQRARNDHGRSGREQSIQERCDIGAGAGASRVGERVVAEEMNRRRRRRPARTRRASPWTRSGNSMPASQGQPGPLPRRRTVWQREPQHA